MKQVKHTTPQVNHTAPQVIPTAPQLKPTEGATQPLVHQVPDVELRPTNPGCRRRGALWIVFALAVSGFISSTYAQEPATPVDETQVIAEGEENSPSPAESAPSPPPPANQHVPSRLEEQQRRLLSELKGPPGALWLPVEGGQVLAFWQPDLSGKPQGAVLMLHAEGESPRRAATLRRLHEYLPIHGWATFSMELPDLPAPAIPERPATPAPAATASADTEATPATTAADPAAAPAAAGADVANDKPVDETQVVHQEASPEAETVPAPTVAPEPAPSREEVMNQIQQRIQAATDYLNQQGQFNLVLLGEGVSAHWVLQHLDKAVPPAPVESADKKSRAIIERAIRAVVLVNVRTPEDAGLDPLTDWLRHPEVPTFDVFTDLDLNIRTAAQVRRQAARQKNYENYVQRRLPPPNGADPDADETLLTKAIRGFLQNYAKGVELK